MANRYHGLGVDICIYYNTFVIHEQQVPSYPDVTSIAPDSWFCVEFTGLTLTLTGSLVDA